MKITAQTPVFTVATGATVDAGTLTLRYYDLNGDGVVDIYDNVIVGQHRDIFS